MADIHGGVDITSVSVAGLAPAAAAATAAFSFAILELASCKAFVEHPMLPHAV